MQKITILGSENWVFKKWQTSAITWEIFNFNLETGRHGPESGVSWIIRESWQHSIREFVKVTYNIKIALTRPCQI